MLVALKRGSGPTERIPDLRNFPQEKPYADQVHEPWPRMNQQVAQQRREYHNHTVYQVIPLKANVPPYAAHDSQIHRVIRKRHHHSLLDAPECSEQSGHYRYKPSFHVLIALLYQPNQNRFCEGLRTMIRDSFRTRYARKRSGSQ